MAPGHIVAAGPTISPNAATPCGAGKVPIPAKTRCVNPARGYFALPTTTNGSEGHVKTACNSDGGDADSIPDHPASSTGWT